MISTFCRYSALLHDYGKIGVPEAVPGRTGDMTPDEYAQVQSTQATR